MMIEKKFVNNELEIELVSNIDNKQNIWFRGKHIAQILGYNDTDQAIRKHVDAEDKKTRSRRNDGGLATGISYI